MKIDHRAGMAFDRDQFVERLQQIRRPLEFAARQNVRKIAVLQDLEARLLEWLEAATAYTQRQSSPPTSTPAVGSSPVSTRLIPARSVR